MGFIRLTVIFNNLSLSGVCLGVGLLADIA